MNTVMQVDAYKSFYDQGMNAYKQKDFSKAKELLLKSAKIANSIAQTSSSNEVKNEYQKIARRLLEFVKLKCCQKTIGVKEQEDDKQEKAEVQNMIVSKSNIKFSDVAGLQDVKEQIKNSVIEPLKKPELAKAYNIKPGAKILLYGPPGTGKTFIARAIAGEIDATFYSVNCQDLISKYMGESSKQLETLFEEAEKNERAIIFFDEFDSMASKRTDGSSSVDEEMNRFVATFLTKVDGLKQSKTNKMLLLIAATNRPWALESAMIRGGRFDTHIYVGVPDKEARRFLINKEFKGVPVSSDFDIEELISLVKGYGGGDIVSICRKIRIIAYSRAIKSDKIEDVTRKDYLDVMKNQKNIITAEELERFEQFRDKNIGDK